MLAYYYFDFIILIIIEIVKKFARNGKRLC